MKVVIDISPLKNANRHRGVGAYTRNLVKALQATDDGNEYILTSKPQQTDADIIHYPYFDLYFLTLPFFKQLPTVVTIHDTIPLVFPKNYPPGLRGKLKFLIQKQSLHGAGAIITDSNQSKKDIGHYLDQPDPKIHRIYLAADSRFQPLPAADAMKKVKRYGLTEPYWMYVGDVNFNKNLPALLKAYSQTQKAPPLVLVSRALRGNSPEAKALKELVEELKLTKRVNLLDSVPLDPIDDLQALYSAASWYIQPSIYEGFGLPVLEAMACGTPVISSTGGSLQEILPRGALAFDPNSIESLKEQLEKALAVQSKVYTKLAQEARNFSQQFSWAKVAEETKAVYRQLLQ